MKRLLTLLLILLTACSKLVIAQTSEPAERPVKMNLMAGIGQGSMRNTYLTPLLYTGRAYGVRFERTRMMRDLNWDNSQWIDADLTYQAEDKGNNSSSHTGRIRYRYGMHRYLYANSRYCAALGWTAGADLGFDYNLKMAAGNNPATVRAVANTGLSLKGGYNYKLRHQPCVVSLQLQTPLLGVAMMPEYGASYYETFMLKNTDHNVHFTSLHNQQDLDVRLTTDIPFSVIPHMTRFGTSLRVGMAYHIETMDINHIVTRQSTIQFLLGWTWQYLPYKPTAR